MKHSELNTADALHYAKARTFTGEVASVTPDFIDQLLVKSEDNTTWLATGQSQGQLIQLAASGGGSALDTEAFLDQILMADGQILTTDSTIIYQN
jgi:hypothetical protein